MTMRRGIANWARSLLFFNMKVCKRTSPPTMSVCRDKDSSEKSWRDENCLVVGWGGRAGTLRGLLALNQDLRAEAERKSHEDSGSRSN